MPQNGDRPHDWSEPPKNWAEEQARRTALEVRRLRGKRSAQWLADKTGELGSPVTRAVISDLELGRRRYVTTAELIVLAAALETAPITLLYPPPYDEIVELVPDVTEAKIAAVEWFCSDSNAVKYKPGKRSVDDFADLTRPLYAARGMEKLQDAQRSLLSTLARESDLESPLAQSIRRELEHIDARIAEFRTQER